MNTARVFTPAEVVALTDIPEPTIRKYIMRFQDREPRVDQADLVFFYVVSRLDVQMTPRQHDVLRASIRAACDARLPTIEWRPHCTLSVYSYQQEVEAELERFEGWKAKLVEDKRILGGEPVFPGTRIAVRHIGGMLEQGVDIGEIREDFPTLSEVDLVFAKRYTKAYPRRGRPRVKTAL